jgi:hypothetical protein
MKNILISRSKSYSEEVQRIKDLLSEKGYNLKDSSINTDCIDDLIKQGKITAESDYDAQEIFKLCSEWAEIVVVFVDQKTGQDEQVCNEIEIAHRNNKEIIGVVLPNVNEGDIPENLKKYATKGLVNSAEPKIVDSITGKEEVWQEVDGQARKTPLAETKKPKAC